jgi:hypothetical protein
MRGRNFKSQKSNFREISSLKLQNGETVEGVSSAAWARQIPQVIWQLSE